MAEIFTDEGIDTIMGVMPKNGTNFATLYCGLFTSQSATTVPARTATGGASPSGWTEAAYTSYARQSIAAASWGAQATNGSGRKTTAGQVTFPTVGATERSSTASLLRRRVRAAHLTRSCTLPTSTMARRSTCIPTM
jgi:hypothetical protein